MARPLLSSAYIWGLLALAATAHPVLAQNYTVTNLTSDGFISAPNNDPNLVNPWGLSRSSASPWWASDNGKGVTTLYNGSGVPAALVVTIPAAEKGNIGKPTGTIFNGTQAFQIAKDLPAAFLFATEDGTISGWNPKADPTNAIIKARTPKGVYKGLTSATIDGKQYLYATNFHSGHVDVFDENFQPVSFGHEAFQIDCDLDDLVRANGACRTLAGQSGELIRGFVPYNIQNSGGTLFVSFAQPDADHGDSVSGPGLGLVAAFTPGGKLIRVYQHVDGLNAPWGLVVAPSDFGGFSHALLVGQFGSGEVLAFNILTGQYLGKMLDANGKTIAIDGLWALSFGNGANAGPLNSLFFTAGPDEEGHGLFGSLTAVASTQTSGNAL